MTNRYRVPYGAGRALVVLKLAHGVAPHAPLSALAASSEDSRQSVLYVLPDTKAFEDACEDLRFFLTNFAQDNRPLLLPFQAWDVLPFDLVSPAPEVSAGRLSTLWQLLHAPWSIVVTTASALLQRLVPPRLLVPYCFELRRGMECDRDLLVSALEASGYRRNTLVEEPAQYAVRGAVLDFFPATEQRPVRLELFDNEVESIRAFECADQRSVAELDSAICVPASEFLPPLVRPIADCLARRERVAFADMQPVLDALRARVRELDVPLSVFRPIEEAFTLRLAWPGIEHLQPFLDSQGASLVDYLGASAAIVVADETDISASIDQMQSVIEERAVRMAAESRLIPSTQQAYLRGDEVLQTIRSRAEVALNAVHLVTAEELQREGQGSHAKVDVPSDDVRDLQIYNNASIEESVRRDMAAERPYRAFAVDVQRDLDHGLRVTVIVGQEPRRARLAELLSSYEIPTRDVSDLRADGDERSFKAVDFVIGTLSAGVYAKRDRLRLIVDREILPDLPTRRRSPAARSIRRFLGTLAELREGDFVVHADHGIGVYRGLRTVTVDNLTADFMELEYAEQAKLLLPIDQIGRVQKYVGAEGIKPNLSKLGGKAWTKAKEKVQQNVAELAGQLLTLYAQREVAEGFAYGEPDGEDARFADTFPL